MLQRTISCLLVFATCSIANADWPQWRGPNRTGFVDSPELTESLPENGKKPKWKFDSFPGGTSGGWGSPVISNNQVYVYSHAKNKKGDAAVPEKKFPWLAPEKRVGMSDEEYQEYEVKRRNEDEQRSKAFKFTQRLVCLDLDNGQVVWEKQTAGAYTRFVQSGTPCVANGKVFVLGPARTALCYDAKTGALLWEKRLPGEFRDEYFGSSFIVHENVALVACGPLYALNTDDGKILWNGDENHDYSSHSSPTVWSSGNTALAICNTEGGRTEAYRIADGKQLWELTSGTARSSPIIAGDLLLTYGGSRKNGLTAFKLGGESKPEQLWQFRGAADSGTTPVVRGGYAFVQGEKRVAKVDLSDGSRVWQTSLKISKPKYTSMIAAGKQVFFAWEGIMAFDAESKDFSMIYDAEVDSKGRLIEGDKLRKELKLDEIASREGGLAESEKLWQKEAVESGPLACTTPAFSDGKLVVRLRDSVVCYDLAK